MDQKMISAVLLLLICALAEACHSGLRRRKREVDDYYNEPLQTEVFFTECLTKLVSETPWHWKPVTEFVVKYSDWFKKTGTLYCSQSRGEDNVECWKNATRHVFRKESEILPAVYACIDAFPGYSDLIRGVTGSDASQDLLQQLAYHWVSAYFPTGSNHYKKGIASTDKIGCPVKNPEEYTKCMRDELQDTDENIGNMDYEVLSRFMDEEGDCDGPDCDCSAMYGPGTVTYEYFRAMRITCRDCWATRIAGSISNGPETSRLRKAAIYCSSLLSRNSGIASDGHSTA